MRRKCFYLSPCKDQIFRTLRPVWINHEGSFQSTDGKDLGNILGFKIILTRATIQNWWLLFVNIELRDCTTSWGPTYVICIQSPWKEVRHLLMERLYVSIKIFETEWKIATKQKMRKSSDRRKIQEKEFRESDRNTHWSYVANILFAVFAM